MQPTALQNKLAVKAVANIFFKLFPSDLQLPIIAGPLKGSRWISGASPGEAKGLSTILNLSESQQMNHAVRLLSKNMICYDVGANVGVYSLLFAKYSKFVYSFEPLPRNIRYLKRTLEINKINNAFIVQKAMTKFSGSMRFLEGKYNSSGGLNSVGGLTVDAVSCDDFAVNHQVPSLMKIDVEGAEMDVLLGAEKTLNLYKPTILLSAHSRKLANDCTAFLQAADYTMSPINDPRIDCASEFIAISRRVE